ncbi:MULTISPECIES: helix-turn-helix transcriptional regulator [Ekhidna]|uniref:Transcriptional regulator PadR-like family protein n=1 Tax=Ekhidna lutea TaxID=447679 RepID=A0A239GM61_EKHLU|nr:helix-turn-helix transcriptional regulator [Ekhidna lutea]SNS70279.1 Transcriptional regulator PadR-like family protein [Ekhidna lutea]
MKGNHLGELEELVLLTVGSLYNEAYGVAVMDEIRENAGRDMNISAIHAVLRRLEEKGLLKSHMGGSTNERGGRRKRLFTLTKAGKLALDQSISLRQSLYERIPNITYSFSI